MEIHHRISLGALHATPLHHDVESDGERCPKGVHDELSKRDLKKIKEIMNIIKNPIDKYLFSATIARENSRRVSDYSAQAITHEGRQDDIDDHDLSCLRRSALRPAPAL